MIITTFYPKNQRKYMSGSSPHATGIVLRQGPPIDDMGICVTFRTVRQEDKHAARGECIGELRLHPAEAEALIEALQYALKEELADPRSPYDAQLYNEGLFFKIVPSPHGQ